MRKEQNNRVIAEYMELLYAESDSGKRWYNHNGTKYATISLPYNDDWNEIMDVLQKLLPELKATQREGELESHIVAIEMALLELDIEKVFLATTEAIKQLNELKNEESRENQTEATE